MYFRFILSDIIHGAGMQDQNKVRTNPQLHQPMRPMVAIPQRHFAIEIKEENRGTLTALAERYHKTPLQMAYYIKKNQQKFDEKWQKRATFCINASKWKH